MTNPKCFLYFRDEKFEVEKVNNYSFQIENKYLTRDPYTFLVWLFSSYDFFRFESIKIETINELSISNDSVTGNFRVNAIKTGENKTYFALEKEQTK